MLERRESSETEVCRTERRLEGDIEAEALTLDRTEWRKLAVREQVSSVVFLVTRREGWEEGMRWGKVSCR